MLQSRLRSSTSRRVATCGHARRPLPSAALFRLALVLVLVVAARGVAQQTTASPPLPSLAQRYCAECHDGAAAEKGWQIATAFGDASGEAAGLALLRLRSRTMPPPDAEQPGPAERLQLQTLLAERVPALPDAQAPTLRRLARAEYLNTVHDLFGLRCDVGPLLPEDNRVYGFDNLGDGNSVTPLLFEKYLDAAGAVADRVLDDAGASRRLSPQAQPLATSIAALLDRAFRRPASQEEIDARCRLYDRLRAHGAAPRAAMHAVLRSILSSGAFLFRVENERADGRLSDHELAVRLSYLLRASMPDAALLARAAAGDLGDPDVLRSEGRRLLAADGGKALAHRFAAQWLRFVDVLGHNADFRRYPQIWNGGLRPALLEETTRFFVAIAVEDRSVLELIDADFTFANKLLREHYGLPAGAGGDWERVQLTDRRRGGVLGMGAMLMVSSYPLRTSPVLRGKWVLDHLLDTPPPPPPADAGVLPADDVQPDALTLRQRLQVHRSKKSCAACHAQIDPLGFALENFDVLGRWRDEAQGQAIDTRGELPDGTQIDGPIALKDALLARRDDFVRAMAKNLLVYAIGRPLHAADEAELLRITAATGAAGYRLSALLDHVLTSPLFTTRGPTTAARERS